MSSDNVANFVRVLTYFHSEISLVRESSDRFEELDFGEGFGEEEEGSSEGRSEVDLVRESDSGVVEQDLDLKRRKQ